MDLSTDDRGTEPRCSQTSYPQGSTRGQMGGEILPPAQAAMCGVSAMSSRNAAIADAVVPFAPKLNGKPETADTLEKAGHLILEMVGKAANAAEASYQQAVETSRKLSGQLRGAEDRIQELEVEVRRHQDRADRAEKWLYQISVEIEQKFLGRDDRRPSQPPAPQVVSGQHR